MTQEQKQFITKALQTGIPALAQEYIAALEEITRISDNKQKEFEAQEGFQLLNQEIYDVTRDVIQASAPYMAAEYINAYNTAVNVCLAKFNEVRKAREEKEKAEAEIEQMKEEKPASDNSKNHA